jgi:protease secretion system membrane fusion protein
MSNTTPLRKVHPAPAVDITDVEDASLKSDTKPVIRLGFWVLIIGFGLFLLWAAFAPLDEGVAAPATVSIETRRKTIQHFAGGVVQSVAVKEGQQVKQGDLLITLDDATIRANYEAVRQNYLSQRALESRLLAEISNAGAIQFHPDLLAAKSDPIAAQHMLVQQQLFNSRRASQQAEIAAARQSIAGTEGQIAGMRQMLDSRRAQAGIQEQQVKNVRSLADDGFAPRNQALQLEQAQAELRTTMADLQTNIQRSQSAIAELKLKIAQREQEYLKEVSTNLAEVRREVQANQEKLVAISTELGRMQIKAPVAGQVIGLQVAGQGGVVQPGQHLMDIVPQDATLLLDVKIPPQVIDRVKVGEQVEVRFSTFADAPQLVVHGKIVSLAGDSINEQVGGTVQTYYLARAALTPEGLKALGNRTLQPGMTAEVLVKTGERSLLTYLLHPLMKRIATAMTEE